MNQYNRPEYTTRFLAMVCLLSLALNLFLLTERKYPDFITNLRLSFKHIPPVTSSDHIRGDDNARTTVVEYSDFQCPFCKELHSSLKTLSEEHRIRWVFRNRPLESVHPLAVKSAVAAECAAEQGKFWGYADSLFENQDTITSDRVFTDISQRLALNSSAFQSCLKSNISGLVRRQSEAASELEIDTTPTFFIGSKRYVGALSLDEISGLLDQGGNR